jgi:hypothetical protein
MHDTVNGSIASRIIRRSVYAILIGALVFAVVMREMSASHDAIFVYLQTIQTALVFLLLWSAIFTRSEPTLTRIALVVIMLSFFLTFWIYRL